MRRLGKAEQKQVLKGIAKVSENPLPSSQGGYGKPLRNESGIQAWRSLPEGR